MLWTHNATWGISPDTKEGQVMLSWLPAVGWVLAILAASTVLLNLLLILSILVHEHSRSRSFHMHIVNFAVASVIQGAAVLPLWAFYLMEGEWIHGDAVCRWWLAADTMATSASSLGLVMMACDRFIYLLCWRNVREGSKYITSSVLMALAWLLTIALTLALTLIELEGEGSRSTGVQGDGQCGWGAAKDERVTGARLIVYAVGAGFGAGLSVALVTMSCCGLGHLLPIDEEEEDEDDDSDDVFPAKGKALRGAEGRQLRGSVKDEDEDFPVFKFRSASDRLEERERWRWQVCSLVAVAVVWVVMWLPSHLFVFAHILHLDWHNLVPHAVVVAFVVVGYANATITPLLWLLHGPIRKAIVDLFLCRCCRSDGYDDDSAASSSMMECPDVGPYRPTDVAT